MCNEIGNYPFAPLRKCAEFSLDCSSDHAAKHQFRTQIRLLVDCSSIHAVKYQFSDQQVAALQAVARASQSHGCIIFIEVALLKLDPPYQIIIKNIAFTWSSSKPSFFFFCFLVMHLILVIAMHSFRTCNLLFFQIVNSWSNGCDITNASNLPRSQKSAS